MFNKKLLLAFLAMCMMLLGSVSAETTKIVEHAQMPSSITESFGEVNAGFYLPATKEYNQDEQSIQINNFGIFGKLAEYRLVENEASIINARSVINVTTYTNERLLDNLVIKNTKDQQVQLKSLQVFVSYVANVSVRREISNLSCTQVNTNGTLGQSCNYVMTSNESVIEERLVTVPYDNEVVPAGEYSITILAERFPNQVVDWVITAFGRELGEWAWWNTNWAYKKAFYFNETGNQNMNLYTAVINISYSTFVNLNYNNFTDLCFVNSAETAELPTWQGNYTAGASSIFFINISNIVALTNYSFWAYYGSAGACSRSKYGALNIISANTSQPALATTAGASDIRGYQAQGTNSFGVWLVGIVRATASTMTTGYWLNSTSDSGNGNKRTSCTFGDNGLPANTCDFAVPYNISYNIAGSAVGDSGGAGYTQAYSAGFNTFPQKAGDMQTNTWFVENANVRGFRYINQTGNKYSFGTEQTNTAIIVSQMLPLSNYNTTSQEINFSTNATTTSANITNISIWISYVNGTPFRRYVYNLSMATNLTTVANFTVPGIPEESYTWIAGACGYRLDDLSLLCASNTSTRTFAVDLSPPNLTFNSIRNVTATTSFPVNMTFFINQTDAHPGSCWSEFGGVNVTRTCGQNFNISVNTFGNFTVRGWVNDTLGASTYSDIEMIVVFYNQSQTGTIIAEGGLSTITLVVNGSTLPTIATLRYNNTNYAPTTQTVGINGTLFSYSLVIPVGWGNTTGRLQFWNWTFTIAGVNTTTATLNQSIVSLSPSDCSSGGDLVYNFTIYNESTKRPFNASLGDNLQIDLNIRSYYDSSIVVHYNTTKTNAPSILVCVTAGALTGNTYRVDGTGSYVGTGLVQEFYYMDNESISATNIPQRINWYDLNVDDSTTFLFTFLDENGVEVPNIIVQTLRYYIGEATFTEVERSKADNNGETHIHLVEEDVIYKFNITLEGQSIFLSDQYNAKCLSTPCSITLSAQPDNDPFPTVYNNLPEGSYRIVADENTRDVTLYFNLNQSALMNLTIWTANNNVAVPIISGTTTASAGQVTVNVPLAYGNATYTGVIYMNNNFVASQVVELEENANDYFGAMGLFLASLAVLCLALIGSTQGEWVILWTVLGVVVSGVMFLVDVPWYGLMTFVAGAGVLLLKLVQRRRIS